MRTNRLINRFMLLVFVATLWISCDFDSPSSVPGYFYISRCEMYSTGNAIELEWTSSDNAEYYEIYRNYKCIESSWHITTYFDSNIESGENEYYVVAHNSYGTYTTDKRAVYNSNGSSGGSSGGSGSGSGSGGSGGSGGGSGSGGSSNVEEWVAVSASGYLPYWYCPSDGTTTPSVKQHSSSVSAYKNTKTGAYKVTWAYKEYAAHKGYNKIKMDEEYHTTYNSITKRYGTCCDYYYYEFTIYD